MALKTEIGKAVDLLADAVDGVVIDLVALHAFAQLYFDLRHARAGAFVPHGPAQFIGLLCCEFRQFDGHLHALFLEERHAQGALENGLEIIVQILHRFESGPPSQIRMHHLPRIGPGRMSATSTTRS